MELKIKTKSAENKMWLHQGFMSGKTDDLEYELTCGAGCGNDKLIFCVTNLKTKETIREYVSMKEVFENWVEEAVKNFKNSKE